MTKDEIKALVNGTIAGQGSQVDIGGKLAKILNEIIDAIPEGGGGAEPLFVNGKLNTGDFVRDSESGNPTFDDAVEAFLDGRTVQLVNSGDESYLGVAFNVASYMDDDAGEGTYLVCVPVITFDGYTPLIWRKPQ